MKIILHIIIFVLLTVVTQIGGVVYVVSVLLVKRTDTKSKLKRIGTFAGLYLLSTFLIIPNVAPIFGRVKLKETELLKAHSFFYKLANRNYVRPELNETLKQIAVQFEEQNSGIKLMYLDANFPFIDKFPLLPHLSHNDGKKIDVSLIYENPNGQLTNKKPSVSGYGIYEPPKANEYDQNTVCKNRGNWQYDFPKYLSFGAINKQIVFSKKGTRDLVLSIVKQGEVGKVFIEPHLKDRLILTNGKVRFHGCQAVRHDDHIHFQLK
ncbi:hypothetical protein [Marinirhabdus gelatinilytica]|uniref:Uncharacterized protein n=1 Tax=Marinirhabdus gelatinilytica TaxID=1703343 RepID=A0A370QFW5_9FLAO|nr:hypothetical protein [Marinirhabdus gelatinilytica]RDK87255.1 hypothetical protein C8D94_102440 [Marinirhabdus gelatinilytica]